MHRTATIGDQIKVLE
jgi:hypothetical protein